MSDLDRAVAGRVVADRVETLCISIRVGIGITGSSPTTPYSVADPSSLTPLTVHGCAPKPAKEGSSVLTSADFSQRRAAGQWQRANYKNNDFFSSSGASEREGVVDQRDGGIVEQH